MRPHDVPCYARRHATPLCDVLANCAAVRASLRTTHPCLAAQLLDNASQAWSVPMATSGAVSAGGSCSPLAPMAAHRSRRLDELYVPSSLS